MNDIAIRVENLSKLYRIGAKQERYKTLRDAHVEAGLRSSDRTMPEEINRVLTDQISDFLFTPSPDANENLKKEGVSEDKIFLVGNVMVDSLLFNLEIPNYRCLALTQTRQTKPTEKTKRRDKIIL